MLGVRSQERELEAACFDLFVFACPVELKLLLINIGAIFGLFRTKIGVQDP